MEEQVRELQNEIETIKRFINGYIWQNPALLNIEVKGISFMAKDTTKGIEGEFEKDADTAFIRPLTPETCKICYNEAGEAYPYCYPGSCPEFRRDH